MELPPFVLGIQSESVLLLNSGRWKVAEWELTEKDDPFRSPKAFICRPFIKYDTLFFLKKKKKKLLLTLTPSVDDPESKLDVSLSHQPPAVVNEYYSCEVKLYVVCIAKMYAGFNFQQRRCGTRRICPFLIAKCPHWFFSFFFFFFFFFFFLKSNTHCCLGQGDGPCFFIGKDLKPITSIPLPKIEPHSQWKQIVFLNSLLCMLTTTRRYMFIHRQPVRKELC